MYSFFTHGKKLSKFVWKTSEFILFEGYFYNVRMNSEFGTYYTKSSKKFKHLIFGVRKIQNKDIFRNIQTEFLFRKGDFKNPF